VEADLLAAPGHGTNLVQPPRAGPTRDKTHAPPDGRHKPTLQNAANDYITLTTGPHLPDI
jgi:hypothetical protein